MDLRELRLVLRRHFVIALLAFQIIVAIGAAAAFLPAKTYESVAALRVDVNVIDSASGESVRTTTVQEAQFSLPALERQVVSVDLKEAVRGTVSDQFVAERVAISARSDTSVLEIVGRGETPLAVAEWVNATAFELVEVNRQSASPVELQVIDEARARRNPVAPNVRAIMASAIALGLIAAIFAALAADRIRKSFDVHQAIRDRVGTTVLGEIPSARLLRRGAPVVELLRDDSDRLMTSAFENIRANVEFRATFEDMDTLAVVSYEAGVGKSTVSAGLGWAMAEVERDVVLVEADLRRPVLFERLGANPGPGIGEMAAMEGLEPPLQDTALPHLKLLAAGLPAGRPADVIARTLPGVIETLRAKGATIVMDPPPLNGIPETATIASLAENVILVINSDASGLDDLPAALDAIHDAGAQLVGVVVNRVPRRRLNDSYYSYSSVREEYSQQAGLSPIGNTSDKVNTASRRSFARKVK